MKDRVLSPDEIPIYWGLNEGERKALIRLAERLDGRKRNTLPRHFDFFGVQIGLAPLEGHDGNTASLKVEEPLMCGTAELNDKILRRLATKEQQ